MATAQTCIPSNHPAFIIFAAAIFSLAVLPSTATSQDKCFSPETAKVEESRRTVDQDDPVEMNRWYKQATDANHAGIIHRLARTSFARQDYQAAFVGYEKGAHLGDFEAMYDLGVMWLKGEGREVDLSKGYAWYRLAGDYVPTQWEERFPPEQIKWFKALAVDLQKKLTPEQLEAGTRYYEEQKKLVVCDWFGWYKDYLKTAKRRS